MAAVGYIQSSAPSAATWTTLFTVSASKLIQGSSIIISNRTGSPATFQLAHRDLGAALANSHYLTPLLSVPANDSYIFTIGLVFKATDKLDIYDTSGALTFRFYGLEYSV